MSEIERNESTGQFEAPKEQLYGREEALAKDGWTVLPKADPEENAIGSDPDSLRAAADDLADRRPVDITLTPSERISVEGIDPSLALTVEEATQLRTAARSEISTFTDGLNLDRLAEEIDAKRAEAIQGDPAKAEKLGVEMPKDPALTKAEKAQADEIDAIDGLDPETRRALKIPQVRQALDEEFTKADQKAQAYSTGLESLRVNNLAVLGEVAPHLMGLPPAEFERGLAVLAEVDPPAFQKAMNVLERAHAITQAQWQQHRQQATVQNQQFEQHVRSEDQRLVQMLGSKKAADAANAAMITYLDDHGVPRDQRLNTFMSNPVLRTAEARETIWKAAKYDEMQKAAKPHPTRAIPPVSKPGNSANPRASDKSVKLESLQKQLSSASGEKALRLASQIRQMRRAS